MTKIIINGTAIEEKRSITLKPYIDVRVINTLPIIIPVDKGKLTSNNCLKASVKANQKNPLNYL